MGLTRSDIARRIMVLGHTEKAALELVDEMFGVMAGHLENGENLEIRGFGSLRWVDRKAKAGRNPRTGEAVPIPARRALRFRPAKNLAARVVAVGQ